MSPNTFTTAFELLGAAPAPASGPEWLELFDPHTNRVVYANIVCHRPVQLDAVARDPNGEWWELIDEETSVPYYYNSTTGATEWDPPESATVVPFHALLTTSVGRRLSMVVSNRGSVAFTSEQADLLTRKASRVSLRSAEGRLSRKNSRAASISRHRRKASTASAIITSIGNPPTASPSEPVTVVAESEENDFSLRADSPTDSFMPERRTKSSSIVDAQQRLESHTRPENPGDSIQKTRHRLSAQRNSQSETALETLKEALAAATVNNLDEQDEHEEEEEEGQGGSQCNASAEKRHSGLGSLQTLRGLPAASHLTNYSVPASANVEHFRNSENMLRMDPGAAGRPRNHSEQPFHAPAGPVRMSTADYFPNGSAATVMMHSHRNRSMPSIRADSGMYGMRTFASTQFASQKRGFLRRKVPLEEMISYTSEPLTRSLMNLPRDMNRDAVRSFRVIQRFMGNSDEDVSLNEKFSDVLWLANVGVRNQPMRDEVFCQLAKQVTGNPSPTASEKGWTLLGVLLYAFRPTQVFLPHLEAFVDSAPVPTLSLKRFLRLQLGRVKRTGSRTSELSVKELRLAMTVPSRPLVFGGALGEIMADPELVNRNTGLPRVLEQLVGLITSLDGESTEGLFRVPGNSDAVFITRLRIEAGQPDFSDVTDPNVPASLLKEWLRDLADPLIPESMYDECMANPSDPALVKDILERIPDTSLRVIKYLLAFLSGLLRPNVQAKTKMDSSNLALLLGPTMLRNPVNDLKDVFANYSGEQIFVQTLLDNFSF
ncbi:hypothetical protein IWW45_006811 [Coemansia sp. RSA 485]|nr:hypothetical protein IWW45_006811 [Coemansia sp. RSA 485]